MYFMNNYIIYPAASTLICGMQCSAAAFI